MKKILSFMLVLAMLAMMCINVAAAGSRPAGNFIGTHGHPNDDNNATANDDSIDDGVTSFNPTSTDAVPVIANVSSAVIHRYAVDITYEVSDISISGDSEWDVNELKYKGDINVSSTLDSVTNNYTDVTANTKVHIGNFSIVNYSDLAVYASVNIAHTYANVPITCFVEDNVGTTITEDEIGGVYASNRDQAQNVKVTVDYDAYVTSTDWANAVAVLNNEGSNLTIAKLTFTISSEQPANDAGTN